MTFLGYLLLGFAPGLFWLWFFRRKDDLEPEPRGRLIKVFLLGCASALLLLVLLPVLSPLLRPRQPGVTRDLVEIFIIVALFEETVKLLAFYLGAWRSKDLDEPLDGILYGIAAALGFASVENVVYLVATGDASVVAYRSCTATLGHVVFTGTMGFFFGLARFRSQPRRFLLMAVGFLLAVGLHGLYDLMLMPDRGKLGYLSILGLLPLCLLLLGLKIRWSRARSASYHPELTDNQPE
jgi:RsiW-degrading membrane proteinase PrsW (M82 family)